MLRRIWVLGLFMGLGVFAQAGAARADDISSDTIRLNLNGSVNTVPVNWGHYWGHGSSYYYAAPYATYSYSGYPSSSYYGYPSYSYPYWGGYGYGGYYNVPAGYWRGYAPTYGWGAYPSYYYGTGVTYPGYWYGYNLYNPYFPVPASYAPTAVWGIVYGYSAPATTTVPAAYTVAPAANVVPAAVVPAVTYPTAVPAQGFDYDGGPNRLVPMPKTDVVPNPASSPLIYNIRLTENSKTPSAKYSFKAYGEKTERSTSSSTDTVLVKDSGSR